MSGRRLDMAISEEQERKGGGGGGGGGEGVAVGLKDKTEAVGQQKSCEWWWW